MWKGKRIWETSLQNIKSKLAAKSSQETKWSRKQSETENCLHCHKPVVFNLGIATPRGVVIHFWRGRELIFLYTAALHLLYLSFCRGFFGLWVGMGRGTKKVGNHCYRQCILLSWTYHWCLQKLFGNAFITSGCRGIIFCLDIGVKCSKSFIEAWNVSVKRNSIFNTQLGGGEKNFKWINY